MLDIYLGFFVCIISSVTFIINYRKSVGNVHAKSLCRSRAGSHFYGSEYEIRASIGLVGSTEKKLGLIMSNF